MDFAQLFPDLQPWVRSLASVWPAPVIKGSSWIFPTILSFHVLALTAAGGAILLPSLRLMGVGLTTVPASQIEKSVRPVLWTALIILAVTGVLMGMVNPMKLYARPAFFVKVIALIGALVLTFGVVRSLASRDGAFTQQAKILAAVGVAIWLASVLVFGTSYGAAPGTFHIILAAWLIVMAFGSNLTRIALGAITAITVVAVGIVTYGVYHPLDDYDLVMEINRWTLRAAAVLIAGFALWEFSRPTVANSVTNSVGNSAVSSVAVARLVGFFTILAWITVATAGRWIGLSTSG